MRNRLNDWEIRQEYLEFKKFQELRKKNDFRPTKPNPYPGGEVKPIRSAKRTANSRSGYPTHKKKKEREVEFVEYKLFKNRLGAKKPDAESPYVPKATNRIDDDADNDSD